jgi:hypothetical protein
VGPRETFRIGVAGVAGVEVGEYILAERSGVDVVKRRRGESARSTGL